MSLPPDYCSSQQVQMTCMRKATSAFTQFDEPAKIAVSRSARRKGPCKRVRSRAEIIPSDGLTLHQREEQCEAVLAAAGIEMMSLTLSRAVELHMILEDKNVKRALRVATVSSMCSESDVNMFFPVFQFALDAALIEFPYGHGVMDTRSAFVKAAWHKIRHLEHVPKGMVALPSECD